MWAAGEFDAPRWVPSKVFNLPYYPLLNVSLSSSTIKHVAASEINKLRVVDRKTTHGRVAAIGLNAYFAGSSVLCEVADGVGNVLGQTVLVGHTRVAAVAVGISTARIL
jgi:hypothetical protein